MKIKKIQAREILDSRGNPTVAVAVSLVNGAVGEAMVPSGASTGSHEAKELRDGGSRYAGKGVRKAVSHVNTILAKKLLGKDVRHQKNIDSAMIALDGTEDKSRLGANAILGVSLACARAASNALRIPLYEYICTSYKLRVTSYTLPFPMMNLINGGRHSDSGLDIQEFMVVPQAKTNRERIRQGVQVYQALKDILRRQGYSVAVGDEGGFAPALKKNEDALILLMQAIRKAGYKPGKDVKLALDCAASEFYHRGVYAFDKRKFSPLELTRVYAGFCNRYPIMSLEDPLAEDDWENWKIFTAQLGRKILLIGDDLFTTNIHLLRLGKDKHVGNAILIKPNQIGTLSETIETIGLAREFGFPYVISHRSGETEDSFIADLSVAAGALYIKTGAPCRSERTSKYNRLLAIEMEL